MVGVRAPHWAHVRPAKFCLGVSGVLHGGDKMAGRENPLEIPKNGLKWFWSGVKEIDIVR